MHIAFFTSMEWSFYFDMMTQGERDRECRPAQNVANNTPLDIYSALSYFWRDIQYKKC